MRHARLSALHSSEHRLENFNFVRDRVRHKLDFWLTRHRVDVEMSISDASRETLDLSLPGTHIDWGGGGRGRKLTLEKFVRDAVCNTLDVKTLTHRLGRGYLDIMHGRN